VIGVVADQPMATLDHHGYGISTLQRRLLMLVPSTQDLCRAHTLHVRVRTGSELLIRDPLSRPHSHARGFLPARCSKRGICYGDVAGWLAGWLGVCPSHAGIVSKQLNLKLIRPSGSPIILVSSDPHADTQFQGEPLQRRVKYTGGWEKLAIFVRFSTEIAVYLRNSAR